MRLMINGEPAEVADGAGIVDLLTERAGSAIAVNGEVVPRAEHATTRLEDGDVIEIVTAVQGG
ncbi:sulfur carrier protein ThiS [Nocardioides sp. NPDC057772]|uniref:sulfur carrier protein ThiS n=1 Tax=Nocardioides sp. NPDC057772 TaxID=3346245 RepID=UPI00367224B4